MKTYKQVYSIGISFSSHGHYKVTLDSLNKKKDGMSAILSDSISVDAYRRETYTRAEEKEALVAYKHLINQVLNANK